MIVILVSSHFRDVSYPAAQDESSLNLFSFSGTCGKSIRTETSWMSPEEFMREVLTEADASWRKDVLWEGKPLNVLIEVTIVRVVLQHVCFFVLSLNAVNKLFRVLA